MSISEHEANKPCGLLGHCPLSDERRLFAEAQEIVLELGLSRAESYQLLAVVVRKWCQRHAARGLRPNLVRCRESIGRAAEQLRQAPRAERVAFLVASLAHDLTACEREYARPAEVPGLLAESALF